MNVHTGEYRDKYEKLKQYPHKLENQIKITKNLRTNIRK